MILNSKTKELIKEGSLLYDANTSYVVTNIIDVYFANRIIGKKITVEIVKHPEKCFEGHKIYLQPLTEYYGMEF